MEGLKPKGMHWRTHYRLVNELNYWEAEADLGFTSCFLGKVAQC